MGNSTSRRARCLDAESERTISEDSSARDVDCNYTKPTVFTDGSELWVYVKTKTTEKRQSNTIKKRWTFRASTVGVSLGKSNGSGNSDANSNGMSFLRNMSNSHTQALPDNYLTIPDESLMVGHVRLYLAPTGQVNQGSDTTPQMSLALESRGRCYFLIGQGDISFGAYPLEREAVLKVGACSLQVVEAYGSAKLDPVNCGYERRHPLPDGALSDNACYICFEEGPGCRGPDDVLVPSPCTCSKPVHRSCLAQWISTKGSRVCSICKAKLPPKFTVDPPFLILQVVRHVRGLQWGGEREYILSFGNGNGKMPTSKKAITLGSGPDCDLQLPDPSVSRVHARISFIAPSANQKRSTTEAPAAADSSDNRTDSSIDTEDSASAAGRFEVEDLVSVSGSYLRVPPNRPFFLPLPSSSSSEQGTESGFPQGEAFYTFKVGRTVVEIRTRLRRVGAGNGNILSRAAGLLTRGRIGVVPGEVLLTPPDGTSAVTTTTATATVSGGAGLIPDTEIPLSGRSRASSCGSTNGRLFAAHLQGSVATVNRFSFSELENNRNVDVPENVESITLTEVTPSPPTTPEERTSPMPEDHMNRGILLQNANTVSTVRPHTADRTAHSPQSQTPSETTVTTMTDIESDQMTSPGSTPPISRSLPPRHRSTSPTQADPRVRNMQRRIAFLHENDTIENALLRAAGEAEEAGILFDPDRPLAIVSRNKGARGSRGQSLVSGEFDIPILGGLNERESHSEVEAANESDRLRAMSCDIASSMGTGDSPTESHVPPMSPKTQSLLGLTVVRAQASDNK